MSKTHDYGAQIVWTGDRGEGTKRYKGYDRTWRIETPGKLPINCSNDPLLGGDAAKPNPEDLLLQAWRAAICFGTCIWRATPELWFGRMRTHRSGLVRRGRAGKDVSYELFCGRKSL
jgi:hypothetical protein